MAPLSGAMQARPQQSSPLAHGSPAGRQSGIGMHIPAMQFPLQQSWATAHGLPAGTQLAPPQTPPLHASAQHAPAAAHVCPLEEQPAGLAQINLPDPAGSAAQTNEQQSPPVPHPLPLAAQSTVGSARGIVSSTSRRQAARAAIVSAIATRFIEAGRRRTAFGLPARPARVGTARDSAPPMPGRAPCRRRPARSPSRPPAPPRGARRAPP